MRASILAESLNENSNRRALVCDEGESVWLYLTAPGDLSVAADCWLFNTIAAPADLSGFTTRDRPPPATAAFVRPGSETTTLQSVAVAITWSVDGEAACAYIEGKLTGFVDAHKQRGLSENLVRVGPYGGILDEIFVQSRMSAD